MTLRLSPFVRHSTLGWSLAVCISIPALAHAQPLVIDGFNSARNDCAGSVIEGNGYKQVRKLLANEGHSLGPGWEVLEPASFENPMRITHEMRNTTSFYAASDVTPHQTSAFTHSHTSHL